VRQGAISLAIDGRFYVPMTEHTTRDGKVKGSLMAGALAPCVHLGIAAGCAILVLGGYSATGDGVDNPRDASTFYSAVGLRSGISIPLSDRIFLPLEAEAVVPMTPIELTLRREVVWRSPLVVGSLLVGLGTSL
jgi:hypothetical protein